MKYILLIVLILIGTTVYFVTRPQPEFVVGVTDPSDPPTGQDTDSGGQPDKAPVDNTPTAEDLRLQAMSEEFEALKKARRNLESRLGRLKVILYGVELPPEERNEISEMMRNGYRLLKNRKLLGAYSSKQEITTELQQVEYVENYIQSIEEVHRAKRQATE